MIEKPGAGRRWGGGGGDCAELREGFQGVVEERLVAGFNRLVMVENTSGSGQFLSCHFFRPLIFGWHCMGCIGANL